jgi:hypothetical protein
VIEAPDRLDIAVWASPLCHGIPEGLDVVNRHTVRITFHIDGPRAAARTRTIPQAS